MERAKIWNFQRLLNIIVLIEHVSPNFETRALNNVHIEKNLFYSQKPILYYIALVNGIPWAVN